MNSAIFYLLPFELFDFSNASRVKKLAMIIDRIKALGDVFLIPNFIYSYQDISGNTYYDALNNITDRDLQKIIFDIYSKNKNCEIEINELKLQSDNDLIGFISDGSNVHNVNLDILAFDNNSLISTYRYLLHFSTSYIEFFQWHKKCFPDLFFTSDSFKYADALGSYNEIYNDLLKCLSYLNDNWQGLYKMEEASALKELSSKTGLAFTGKGRNEKSGFYKDIGYYDQYGELITARISCKPHFKISKHLDKRVYFSWGLNDVFNHRIIITNAGHHWNDKENSKLSLIE